LTIAKLMAWTAIAATWITALKLMAKYGEPLHLAIAQPQSGHSIRDAILGAIPILIVQVIATLAALTGAGGTRLQAIVGATIALIAMFLGGKVAAWIAALTGTQAYLGPSYLFSSSYALMGGQATAIILVSLFARFTGISYDLRRQAQEYPEDSKAAEQ
jgi:heme/copper-type cytochrome/quinol oxidase subunit 3